MGTKHVKATGWLADLAKKLGGRVDKVYADGSAVISTPLPEDHWLRAEYDGDFEPPPMTMRMGTNHPMRVDMEKHITAAVRYALRATTRNGQDDDFDPDALVQNVVVGMLGYFTPNGLSSDAWANPKRYR